LKEITAMDGIQIDLTAKCPLSCGNCTRYCGITKNQFVMPLDNVKRAIDSTIGYPKFTGIMGGDPLTHPDFDAICRYAATKRDCRQLGLWTTLPKGYEHHAQVICDTFYHCYVNDHKLPNIFHWPSLVGIQEVITDKKKMWHQINSCWCQNSWCAVINPRGAWFCEVAGNMAMLWGEGKGWDVEPEWWMRTPKDYIEQMEQWCPRCGMAAPISLRPSIEHIDDISPLNYEALKDKVRHPERLKIHDLSTVTEWPTMAAYKDFDYRNRCADKYGMFLIVNETGSWTPYMKTGGKSTRPEKSIAETYQERFGGSCRTM
jgi:hypothetical protein